MIDAMALLLEAGYRHPTLPRMAGASFVLVAPDGHTVDEADFVAELDCLTAPETTRERAERSGR